MSTSAVDLTLVAPYQLRLQAEPSPLDGTWETDRYYQAGKILACAPGFPDGTLRGDVVIDLPDERGAVRIVVELLDGTPHHGRLGDWDAVEEIGAQFLGGSRMHAFAHGDGAAAVAGFRRVESAFAGVAGWHMVRVSVRRISVDNCEVGIQVWPTDGPHQLRQLRTAIADSDGVDLGIGRILEDFVGAASSASLLVRSDFSDDAAWRQLAAAALRPVEGEIDEVDFQADLMCIDTPVYGGLTVQQLVDRFGDGPPSYLFIADRESMTDPEHPILAVHVGSSRNQEGRNKMLRVVPEAMWMIENNLALGNMDFDDFVQAADGRGRFRGL